MTRFTALLTLLVALQRVAPVPAQTAIAAGTVPAQTELGTIEITVIENSTGKPVPCRVHLKDDAGKPQRAEKLPFWRDHFACPGTVRLELPPGKYFFEIERGPEYRAALGSFTLAAKAS